MGQEPIGVRLLDHGLGPVGHQERRGSSIEPHIETQKGNGMEAEAAFLAREVWRGGARCPFIERIS
jgi:hypothetical protein